jgi:hypothetical protein
MEIKLYVKKWLHERASMFTFMHTLPVLFFKKMCIQFFEACVYLMCVD